MLRDCSAWLVVAGTLGLSIGMFEPIDRLMHISASTAKELLTDFYDPS